MKHFAIVILLHYCTFASGQYTKLIVQLKDKGNNSFSISNPSAFLSKRAIERRIRYNIKIDSTDLPATTSYIDSLRLSGNVQILSISKWLNQVLIQTTDIAAINKINTFPFVISSYAVAPRLMNYGRGKFNEAIFSSGLEKVARQQSDIIDYGNNYTQVHIHEGEYLHNKNLKGSNVIIAVLDAGFYEYKSITAFDSIRLRGQVAGERDLVDFDNSVNEDDIHGMYCLSTMAANWPGKMVGTAPDAKYWLIRTENATSEYPSEEHNWVVGAELADSAGSDIISSSLGYYDFDDPTFNHSYNDIYKNSTTVSKGATIAVRKGMIVMNSAGNAGSGWWKYIGFPADADSVCSVGATNNLGQIAGFSSVGYKGKIKPNIVSVGAGTVIAGANNQPTNGNGTSFSNPNVAGLIACLWQAFPQFNNMKILEAVYKSSDRFSNPDSLYGFGLPNFRRAYEYLEKEALQIKFTDQFIVIAPNPFRQTLNIFLQSPETGLVQLRLLDALGRILEKVNYEATAGELKKVNFTTANSLPSGSYFIQYISNTQKVTKQVIKH